MVVPILGTPQANVSIKFAGREKYVTILRVLSQRSDLFKFSLALDTKIYHVRNTQYGWYLHA